MIVAVCLSWNSKRPAQVPAAIQAATPLWRTPSGRPVSGPTSLPLHCSVRSHSQLRPLPTLQSNTRSSASLRPRLTGLYGSLTEPNRLSGSASFDFMAARKSMESGLKHTGNGKLKIPKCQWPPPNENAFAWLCFLCVFLVWFRFAIVLNVEFHLNLFRMSCRFSSCFSFSRAWNSPSCQLSLIGNRLSLIACFWAFHCHSFRFVLFRFVPFGLLLA